MAMAGAGAAAAAAKRCMNPACGALPASSVVVGAGGDWRKGWPLRSGGFALLCEKCGYGPPPPPPPPPSPLCCLSDSYAPSAPPAARLPNGGAPRLDGCIASCRSASHPLLRLDALPSLPLSTSFFLDNIQRKRGRDFVRVPTWLPANKGAAICASFVAVDFPSETPKPNNIYTTSGFMRKTCSTPESCVDSASFAGVPGWVVEF
jgi:hypothetical protein